MSILSNNDAIEDIKCWVNNNSSDIEYVYTQNGELVFSKYTEIEDSPPLLYNSKKNNLALKNYRIYGNTVNGVSVGDLIESGEHSGEYVVPVRIEGKNLLQNTTTSKTINGVTYTVNDDKSITLTRTSESDYESLLCIKNGYDTTTIGTYDLPIFFAGDSVIPSTNSDIALRARYTDGTYLGAITNNTPIKFVKDVGVIYIQVYTSFTGSATVYPMIRNADITDDTYEPYQTPITTNIYLTEQIRKVGDEAEYIDYRQQKRFNADGTSVDVTLPALPALSGTNILSVDTNIQPSSVYLKGKITVPPTAKIYYYSQDGLTLLYTEFVAQGEDGAYSVTPTKASTAQYDYNFVGWAQSPNSTSATPGITENIQNNKNVYAAYRETPRTYTVYFYNDDGTLLQTVNDVAYGGTATYTGNTPISSIKPDPIYTFSGWLPSNINITADTSCYAQFTHNPEITDSWATISARSAAGTAENYYTVGDYKTIHLEGTMGTVTLNMDVYVYILGFNHNSALEGTGITFGGFKRADVTQENIVLIDAQYGNKDATNLQYFNMSHNRGTDSIHGHNYGGWKGCDMRYDILGSTNVAPSEYGTSATASNIGYDASSTCATNPVSNTLMSCLPSDLRTVMKPIIKYTDNTGNTSDTAQNVTSSVDYLPLLSEFEIFGQRSRANLYEQDYQEQYDYYANSDNSKIKDKYNSIYEASIYWTRSPYYNNSTNFAYVSTRGSVSSGISGFSYGVSPIFLV